MKVFGRVILLIILAGLLVNCASGRQVDPPAVTPTAAPSIPPTETPMPAAPFRVIAYVTGAIIPEIIPYDRLTHINYSFLIPNDDGTFAAFSNAWKLDKIVELAHPADVQVLISVGGWGWDAQFETLAADPARRALFVQNLTAFVTGHELDGADIDWEYPDAGQSAENFLALIQELRTAMPDKLITTAVVSHGENAAGILPATFELFDFVNVMTYDGPDHGTMTQFQTGLDYWQGLGLPPEKTVMGLPFYGHPETIYRRIVEFNPQAAYSDTVDFNGVMVTYNGIPTVQAKTSLAMERASGVMFWTLEQDTTDDLSLLKAIDETVSSEQ